jgi:RHS repeat-associated protein
MTEQNGLYYMKARYYDAEVGRFISEDPMGFEGGSLNLYLYAANNPIMFMDPNGLCINAISDYLGDVFTAPTYESLRTITSQAAGSAGLYVDEKYAPSQVIITPYFDPNAFNLDMLIAGANLAAPHAEVLAASPSAGLLSPIVAGVGVFGMSTGLGMMYEYSGIRFDIKTRNGLKWYP